MEENTVRTIKNNTLIKRYLSQTKLLFGDEIYYAKPKVNNKSNFDLILVTELPNYDLSEDEPIDWKYEKLLNNIIQSIGKKLNYDVLLVSVFRQRPDFNRNPLKEEFLDFEKRLNKIIRLNNPRLILALGKIVGKHFLKKNLTIEKMRNMTSSFQDIPLRITYDIHSILKNPENKKPTWIDFQWVRDFLIN